MDNVVGSAVAATEVVTDGRLVRGQRTRRAILEAACELAARDGLDGVSLGAIASELGVSKSGVFAHFDSKEQLQLETINHARRQFIHDVVLPVADVSSPLLRLWRMCLLRLRHMQSAYEAGCFFYAVDAEFDARPGAVRDRVAGVRLEWLGTLKSAVGEAQRAGELDPEASRGDVAFELDAFALAATGDAMLLDQAARFEIAGRVTLATLRSLATDPEVLPSQARVARR